MKYGEKFERESVPEWSLHNIDYNSLKHHIKVHTTRDQATAIAIPGHPDTALRKFEDGLYVELCGQHERVDLFVSSKADEISRRLQYLSSQIHRLILRCTRGNRGGVSLKRQRRFLKYEQEVLGCGDDIQALSRFVNAQVIAFRKILKKYKKWTGSTTLSCRFKESVLSNPKSFTRRDFSQLQAAFEELLATIRAATPSSASEAATPAEEPSTPTRPRNDPHYIPETRTRVVDFAPGTVKTTEETLQPTGYWNEYDYGSEAGDFDADGGYAIYIDPDEESTSFPGVAMLVAFVTMPMGKMRAWLATRGDKAPDGQHQPLLPSHSPDGYGTADVNTNSEGYSPPTPGAHATDTEADDSYASSDEEGFPAGYTGHFAALPSIADQRASRYRERMLFRGTLGAFALAFVLLGVSAVLIATGRHKLRIEVDAAVTVGAVVSLGCACGALGMAFARCDHVGWANRLAVWVTFAAVCVLNGMLLVLVVGNTAL